MAQAMVEVGPKMPLADAGVQVGGKPTVAADAGAATADEVGRRDRDATPSST
jgi:hypothetical protein